MPKEQSTAEVLFQRFDLMTDGSLGYEQFGRRVFGNLNSAQPLQKREFD